MSYDRLTPLDERPTHSFTIGGPDPDPDDESLFSIAAGVIMMIAAVILAVCSPAVVIAVWGALL